MAIVSWPQDWPQPFGLNESAVRLSNPLGVHNQASIQIANDLGIVSDPRIVFGAGALNGPAGSIGLTDTYFESQTGIQVPDSLFEIKSELTEMKKAVEKLTRMVEQKATKEAVLEAGKKSLKTQLARRKKAHRPSNAELQQLVKEREEQICWLMRSNDVSALAASFGHLARSVGRIEAEGTMNSKRLDWVMRQDDDDWDDEAL